MTEDKQHQRLSGVRVLVIDDEEILVWSIENHLKKLGAIVRKAYTANGGERLFSSFSPDVVICDLRLPDGNGIDLLQKWRLSHPTLPVILMTAHGAVETAISAVRLAAFDYLQKPFNLNDLEAAVVRASEISQLRQKVKRMEGYVKQAGNIEMVGRSKPLYRLKEQLRRIASTNTDTVLIYGESGSGKELAARAVHDWSKKSDDPYIEINCASIPENLLESELFGYEKGAFTDARNKKLGLFEIARSGTIFLDEIGELPMKLQAKLLRVLEYRRFKRLGGVKDIAFSAKIVAATNRNLLQEVSHQRFRSDLYYRINVVPITVPSLKEREDDISLLVDHFLKTICRDLQRPLPKVPEETIEWLKRHRWPGNVRELRNVLMRAMILENPETLLPNHLQIETDSLNESEAKGLVIADDGKKDKKVSFVGQQDQQQGAHDPFQLPVEGLSLNNLEKDLLNQALVRARFNQSRAAELLRISRHTLRYRLEKHGLLGG